MKLLFRLLPSLIIAIALVVSSYILYMGCKEIAHDLDFYGLEYIADAIENLDSSSYFPSEIDVTLHPNTVGNVFPVSVGGSIFVD